MPSSSARWIAATDALSSWSPQPNSQPEPPMAQAPKPTGVIDKSELPSCFVFISILPFNFAFLDTLGFSFQPDPILAVQLAAGCGNPRDRSMSGDRLPVTFSWLAIWYFATASRVVGPKMPSTGPL